MFNRWRFDPYFSDDWRSIEDQINKGLNVNRGPILHTAIQQKRFVIARKFIENGFVQWRSFINYES